MWGISSWRARTTENRLRSWGFCLKISFKMRHYATISPLRRSRNRPCLITSMQWRTSSRRSSNYRRHIDLFDLSLIIFAKLRIYCNEFYYLGNIILLVLWINSSYCLLPSLAGRTWESLRWSTPLLTRVAPSILAGSSRRLGTACPRHSRTLRCSRTPRNRCR